MSNMFLLIVKFHLMFTAKSQPLFCHFNSKASLINHFLKTISHNSAHFHGTAGNSPCQLTKRIFFLLNHSIHLIIPNHSSDHLLTHCLNHDSQDLRMNRILFNGVIFIFFLR